MFKISISNNWKDILNFNPNVILGGSFSSDKIKIAKEIINEIENNKEAFDKLVKTNSPRLKIIAFHPNFSYEDFIECKEKDGTIKNGILKQMIADMSCQDELKVLFEIYRDEEYQTLIKNRRHTTGAIQKFANGQMLQKVEQRIRTIFNLPTPSIWLSSPSLQNSKSLPYNNGDIVLSSKKQISEMLNEECDTKIIMSTTDGVKKEIETIKEIFFERYPYLLQYLLSSLKKMGKFFHCYIRK